MSVLSFRPHKEGIMKSESKAEDRNEEPKPRSIVLPAFVWESVEKDAKRCRRSVTKHIEAILVRYYRLEASIELDEEALTDAFHAVSQKRSKAA